MNRNKNKLLEYLNTYYTKSGEKPTHTRIGDSRLNIKGGSFCIPDHAIANFYDLYYKNVFINNNEEYLTEKQQTDGPIMIDFDFRYNANIKERLHTDSDIEIIVNTYLNIIKDMLEVKTDKSIPIYVFQKPNVHSLSDKTKDGIHVIIGINMCRSLQIILREKVLNIIEEPYVWEHLGHNLTNSWDAVIDSGVAKGTVNWQLYGSRKPDHEAYKLYKWYSVELDSDDDEWILEENNINDFNIKLNFSKLSAQYKNHICFDMQEHMREDFERIEKDINNKSNKKPRIKDTSTIIKFADINSDEMLDRSLEQLFDRIKNKPDEYKLKEIHDYAMILPEQYYGAGSFEKWIRVGWALRNTAFELYLTWLKLSSQSDDFDWVDSSDLWKRWVSMDKDTEGLTERSIIYWARKDCIPQSKFEEIKKKTVSFYLDEAIKSPSDNSFAKVLYNQCKYKYIYASYKGDLWYMYTGNRWEETQKGNDVRLTLSEDIYRLFTMKISEYTEMRSQLDTSSEQYKEAGDNISEVTKIAAVLKNSSKKNHLMREAQELFFMPDFITKLDSNNNLLCFENGVIDFSEEDKSKIFRKGRPEDYNSKSTKINYIPLDYTRDKEIIGEINQFMYELFPKESLRNYMWEHLSSVLIGKNRSQKFNIYTGAGRNGKSCLVELMSIILGDYKGTVPVTLVTDKRGSIGSTSSEVAQLQGVRYAVMQEPSKGASMNEGIMKELTGGDPIQARALWSDSITFVPQFKLVCTLNNLFDVKSNDEGTWRRIRICPFESLFTENPISNDEYKPYQFKVDFNMDEKFQRWKHVFMAMLVDKAFETQGIVEDVEIVLSASNSYRANQDHIAEFLTEYVVPSHGDSITKKEINDEFREWYKSNYGNNVPKTKELHEMMDRRYKKQGIKWKDVKINNNYEDDNTCLLNDKDIESEYEEEPEC